MYINDCRHVEVVVGHHSHASWHVITFYNMITIFISILRIQTYIQFFQSYNICLFLIRFLDDDKGPLNKTMIITRCENAVKTLLSDWKHFQVIQNHSILVVGVSYFSNTFNFCSIIFIIFLIDSHRHCLRIICEKSSYIINTLRQVKFN